MLLVHGTGGHAHWWDPLVPFFLPEYRLVAPDLRGHGESDWPREPAYRITDFGADLLAVVDALAPGHIALIAHSMGTRAAFRFVPPEPGVSAPIVAALAQHAIGERGPGDWTFRFDRAVLSLDGDGAGDLTALIAGLPSSLWIGRGIGSAVSAPRQFDALRARRPDLALHDFAGAHHFLLSDPDAAGIALRVFLNRLPA